MTSRPWLLLIVGGQTSKVLGAALWLLAVGLTCSALYVRFDARDWPEALPLLALATGAIAATCRHLYRLRRALRTILLLIPVLASLAMVLGLDSCRLAARDGDLFALAIALAVVAAAVAWWARPLLRTIVRVLLPNASRYVFEDLWNIDGKLLSRGPW